MTERNLKLEECELFGVAQESCLPAIDAASIASAPHTAFLSFSGLDDLCVRFIINLPEDDLKDIPRICFQVEEAQWYYEDFIRPLDPSLPSMSLRNFCLRIFAHCPLLSSFSQGHHMRAFEDFLAYKTRVPVRGAVMLNASMDSVVLVKGWKKGASWSFPRGKIAKDEDDLTCAVREVYEETGFDLDAAGLVPLNRDVKSIQVNMREQQMRLFVFRNVPMETHFEPRTRKEISKIEWWLLSELPAFRKKSQQQQQQKQAVPNSSKFYMVAPFLVPLRKWVIEQKKKDAQRTTSNQYLSAGMSYDEFLTEEDQGAESATQMLSYEKPSAPELDTDTLEGATAALSRLLKIQPATQGLQAEAATQSSSKNSGEALLALLKPAASSQSLRTNAPHTPLENIVMQPAMPRTPHHQQPRPPHFSNIPPPPDFPIQSRADTFSHREANYQNGLHNVAEFQQGHVGRQNPSRPQENPNSYQSQHLIHPQPLPPHVQTALFTGGPVHSPMISQSIQQDPQPVHMAASRPTGAPQFPGLPATMVPQNTQQSPKLTSHSLALLNAFKTRDQAADNVSSSNDLPLRRYTAAPNQVSTPALRAVPQELPAEGLQPGQMPPPPQIKVQQNIGPLTPTPLAPRQSISATQKSTLLDMFKSPTSQPAVLANPAGATSLPISTTPSVVELSAVEPLSTGASTTSALLNSKRTPDNLAENGAVPVLNPESNLPFRAASILGRPPRTSDKQSPSAAGSELDSKPKANGNKAIGKKPAARMNTGPHKVKSPEKPFQPQILKRPQQSSSKTQQSAPAVQPAVSAFASQPGASRMQQSPTAVSPSSNFQSSPGSLRMPHSATAIQHPVSTFVPPPDRRPSQAVDHKQNLLSMFGKAQAGPISPPGRDGPSTEPLASTATASARSRVGSLASGGDGTSRRGSTPISPADKGFLLGYLEAVAKGSR
ncbi:mRNA decapping complex subunit [Lachnellula occidentalis]|uniref:mRNA decapping complex subunit n=1 Tax=Lachnellula occidentalis TaxID=215460 RepID=A0A8H8RW20_9HELO|nr:mRNA decapping complex subunit [Lachnellula occidentalis]